VEVSVFDALERRLNEYRGEVSEYISGGGIKNMEEYNRLIGKPEHMSRVLTY